MAKIHIVIDADSAEEAQSEMQKLLLGRVTAVEPAPSSEPVRAAAERTSERRSRADKAVPQPDALGKAAPAVESQTREQTEAEKAGHVDTNNVFAEQVQEVVKTELDDLPDVVTLEDVKAAGQAAVGKVGPSAVKAMLQKDFTGTDDRPLAQFSKTRAADFAAVTDALQAL